MPKDEASTIGTVRPVVVAVASSPSHTFSKPVRARIRLVPGRGVEGDAHCGETVRHRSRVARDPSAPNLRQVHLLHAELHDELSLEPGAVGENVTTRGLDLLGLPAGARLRLGEDAVVEVTGLRNPCRQLDDYRAGLRRAFQGRPGVMAIVVAGGEVAPGDPIEVELPPDEHRPLQVV
jgi:MOSC domain-containing protein YiiM